MSPREIAALNSSIRQGYDRIRNALVGRAAEVIGRPEIAGVVDGIGLNPNGVVVVTLKTPRPFPKRIRVPLDTLILGRQVHAPPPPRRQRPPRRLATPPALAIVGGRLAI